MQKLLLRFKMFINQPGVEFCCLLVLPLIFSLKVQPSHWVTIGVLAYAMVIGRVYGSSRWLDGFQKGIEAERQKESS